MERILYLIFYFSLLIRKDLIWKEWKSFFFLLFLVSIKFSFVLCLNICSEFIHGKSVDWSWINNFIGRIASPFVEEKIFFEIFMKDCHVKLNFMRIWGNSLWKMAHEIIFFQNKKNFLTKLHLKYPINNIKPIFPLQMSKWIHNFRLTPPHKPPPHQFHRNFPPKKAKSMQIRFIIATIQWIWCYMININCIVMCCLLLSRSVLPEFQCKNVLLWNTTQQVQQIAGINYQ